MTVPLIPTILVQNALFWEYLEGSPTLPQKIDLNMVERPVTLKC